MTLLGYNIDADELASNAEIKEQVKRTGSNWHLVINHKGYAREIKPFAKKGVIYRAFNPFGDGSPTFDNDFWTKHSALKTADWMKANLDDVSDMYLTAGNNEPSSNPSNRSQLVKWLSDLAKYLHDRQLHGAIGENAVAKTLEMGEIQAGVWDELIETMHALGDWHIWTFHEYTSGLAPANCIAGYPQNLLDRSIADKSKWVNQIPLGYAPNWHIGRWHWLRQRAIDIGKPMKRVVISECVYDYMEDNNENGQWLKNVLRPQFNYRGFEGLKGWEGHKPYWQWLLGKNDDISWQELMFDSIAWNALASAPEVEGLCLFGLNPDWYEWEGVDLSRSGVNHFRQLVETKPVLKVVTNPPVKPPTPDEIIMIPKYVRARDNQLRIRKNPTIINSDTLDWITGTFNRYLVSDNRVAIADGYQWYKVDNGKVSGYSAFYTEQNQALVDIRDDMPTSDIVQISKADYAGILAGIDACQAHLNEVKMILDKNKPTI